MKARRTSGFDIQSDSTGGALPARAALSLYPEALKKLPTGVLLLLLDDLDDARTFRVVDANPAAVEIIRLSRLTVLGKTLADFPGILETPIPGKLLATLRSGENCDLGELAFGDSPEERHVYSVRVFPLSQNCLGVAIEEITDRIHYERTLRESEERFRLVVEGVREYAIFQLDTEGNVASWNAGAQRLKGDESAEIIGKHFSNFIAPSHLRYARENLCRKLDQQAETTYEAEIVSKTGRRTPVEVSSRLVYENGVPVGVQGTARDISERRQTQEALRLY